MSDMVIKFPAIRRGSPAETNASLRDVVLLRLRHTVGRAMGKMGVPGFVRNTEALDRMSGHRVTVSIGDLYVRFSVDDRDFFFDRLTGRFDGTGSRVD